MRLAFPLDNAFMPPGIDGAGTAQGRRRPGDFPMSIAQTIGIEGLVGRLLAAGEALFIPANH
jgi:hypothetical protein